jgi:hypothetical protein
MSDYDIAQVCRRGHGINWYYEKHPRHRKAFCDKCGEPTITHCQSCHAPIQGGYYHANPVLAASYIKQKPPDYCPACGKPYPWTELKLHAARELINELDGLDENERKQLKQSLDDLITDSPKTEVAGLRFKRIMKKVGKDSYEVAKGVLTDILSESAKKILFKP